MTGTTAFKVGDRVRHLDGNLYYVTFVAKTGWGLSLSDWGLSLSDGVSQFVTTVGNVELVSSGPNSQETQ